jgi:hypothetical protein
MLPLSDAIASGAELSYVMRRCSGLIASVLALDSPKNEPNAAKVRSNMEAKLQQTFEAAIADQMNTAHVNDAAARENVRKNVTEFANLYVQMWNSNYLNTGNYLDKRFDQDSAICNEILYKS